MNSKFTLVFLLLLSSLSNLLAQKTEKFELKNGSMDLEFEMPDLTIDFELCGLEKGEEYYMMIMDDRGNKQCSYNLVPSKVNILKDKVDAFVAKGNCMKLDIERFECRSDVQYFFPRLIIRKIQKADTKATPMLLNENSDVEFLVKEVLLGNTCGDVFNITSKGQIGTFSAGLNSIGVEDGIVMSCAPLGQMQGGNPGTGEGGATGQGPGEGNDADLTLLTNRAMRDAAVIEFDFTPVDNMLSFRYVFASDEYCDYAGDNVLFNDGFGFFLSGPGISGPYTNGTTINPGGVNIATVPGTDDPVTIDNIHWYGTYPQYYVSNVNPLGENPSLECSPVELDQGGCCLTETPFDGFTTILTAEAEVIPCQTYHIRLVVADAVDQIFGSAVFIEGGSFSIGDGLDYEVVFNATGSNYLYEGCGDSTGVIQFIRTDQGTAAGELSINMDVDFTGTATKNKDYAITFNQSIDIPPLPAPGFWFEEIVVFSDTIVEQNEFVQLDLEVPCECDQQSLGFTIVDVNPLTLSNIIDVDYCSPQPVIVSPQLEGGLPDAAFNGDVFEYTHFWTGPNGFFSDELQLNHTPPGPGFYQYFFEAFDDCGTTVNDTVNVTITGTPAASIAGEGFVCPENPETALEVILDGPGPWDLVYAIDGVEQTPLNISSSPFMLPAAAEGDYELVSVTSFGCEGEVEGVAQVSTPVFSLTTDPVNPSCFGTNTGTIEVEVSGGIAPYTYAWSDGQTTQQATDISAGSYEVVITDDLGCTTSISSSISDPQELTASTSLLAGTTCAEPTAGQAMVMPSGGTGIYSYQWNSGATTETANGLPSGTALVTVTDENGCSTEQSIDIPADENIPQAASNVNDILTCEDLEVNLNANGSSTGANISYQWSGGTIVSGADTNAPSVSAPGTYQLTVTDNNNGCTNTSTVEVTNDLAAPTANAGDDASITCTETTATLDGSNSTGTSSLSYEWFDSGNNSIGTSATINVNGVDTYTLIVTNDVNGCTQLSTVEVTTDAILPVADAGVTQTLTCTTTELTLDGTNSESGTNYTYEWTALNGSPISDNTSLTPEISEPDTYQILVTNNDNGCTETAEVIIEEDVELPTAETVMADLLTCTETEVQISGTGSSTGNNFSYSWTDSNGTEISTDLNAIVGSPDTYQLQVTNTDNGCTETNTVTVETDEDTPVSLAGAPQTITCDDAMVTLDGSNSTTGATITYSWTNSSGTEVGTTPTIETDVADEYTLTVMDSSNGCEIESSVTVDQNTNDPVALTSAPQTLNCIDTEFIIDGSMSTGQSSNLSYEWLASDGSTIATTATTPVTTPDTYTLLVTDVDNGCTNENTLEISQNIDQPIADAGETSTITCDEVSVPLNASASTGDNLVYEWTNDQNEVISTDAETMTELEGTFAVQVTNTENGCTDMAEVEIEIDVDRPLVDPGMTTNLTCATLEATLDASNSSGGDNLSFVWSDANGNMVANDALTSVTEPGTYEIMVTNEDNNCVQTELLTITQDIEIPTADAGLEQTLSCSDIDVQLTGSASSLAGDNLVYEWSSPTGNIVNGATSLTPTVDQPAIYTLLVTNTDNQCTETAEVEVLNDDNAPVAATEAPDVLNCETPNLFLDGSPSSQGDNFSYSWSTIDGSIINAASTLNPLVNEPGTYTLTVLDQDNGCETSTSVIVDENVELPVADAGAPLLLNCNNETLLTDASGSSAGAEFTYLWTTDNGQFTGNESANAITVTEGGTYDLLVTNTDNGCTNSSSVTVSEDFAAPILSFPTPDILNCITTEVQVPSDISNGQNFSYSWTTSNGNILGDTDQSSIDVDTPGDYTLVVTNLDNGCTEESASTVSQDIQDPDVDAGAGTELTCSVTEAALSGSGSEGSIFNYNWTTTEGNIIAGQNSLTAQANEAGTYNLMITNTENGCTSEDDVIISLNENIPVDIIPNVTPPPCFGDPAIINVESIEGGVGPYQYSLDGVNYSSSPTFTGLEDGTNYNVFILDANGCDLEESLFIEAVPEVTVDLTPNAQIEIGDEQELVTLTNIPANEVASVTWTPSTFLTCDTCLVTTSQATQTTQYTVNVVNIFGCEDSAQIIVEVDRDINIYPPNAFSPFSSGGVNDRYTLFSKEGTIENIRTMRIYDRWGNQVFEDFDFPPNDAINFGWDGTFKGKQMDPGVFVFWAEVELITGQVELVKGDFTLMK